MQTLHDESPKQKVLEHLAQLSLALCEFEAIRPTEAKTSELVGWLQAGVVEVVKILQTPAHGSTWQYRGSWLCAVDTRAVPGKVRCSPEGSSTHYDFPLSAFLRAFTPVEGK